MSKVIVSDGSNEDFVSRLCSSKGGQKKVMTIIELAKHINLKNERAWDDISKINADISFTRENLLIAQEDIQKMMMNPKSYDAVSVSPEHCVILLATMIHNRKITKANILKFINAINNGEWRLCGRFEVDKNGNMMNGQHRALAAIITGKNILMDLRFGLDPEAGYFIDDGKTRTPGDVVDMANICSYEGRKVAAIVKYLDLYLRIAGTSPLLTRSSSVAVKGPKILEYADKYHVHTKRVMDGAKELKTAIKGGSEAVYGTSIYITNKISPSDSTEFFRRIVEADFDNMPKHMQSINPIFRIWDTLRMNASARDKKGEMVIFALIMKAWNGFRDGTEMKTLQFRVKKNPEIFPKAH